MNNLSKNPVSKEECLPEGNAGLAFIVEEQKNIIEKQTDTIRKLEHTVDLLRKALFGQRSERIIDTDEKQGVFESILAEVDDLEKETPKFEEPENEMSPELPCQRKKRSSLQELIPENLPKEEVIIDLPENEKTAPDGTPLKCIGEERVEKLAYKPGFWFLKIFIYPKYAKPDDSLFGVKKASAPDFAIPGGVYDESFLSWLVNEKCSMHLPHYRLEESMQRAGLKISRQTLSSLYIRTAYILKPLYCAMVKDIISREIIFTDDTSVKMLMPGNGKALKTYMWVYAGGGGGPPYRVFDFTMKRSGNCPKKFLKGFNGYVHSDAFNGYDMIFENDDIRECSCWMHVRRKYLEAKDAPLELRKKVLRLIRNIYRYERAIKKCDRVNDRILILRVRNEKIEPIIDDIFKITADALKSGQVLPKSNFADAISYMHNLGDTLKTFIENPYLSPDNGESERALRPLTVGRKNWLFAGSENGGEATAILFSLIQTCRVMKINPAVYIEDVLRRINGHPYNRLEELLPGKWKKADSYFKQLPIC
ncbi:MAG: IS66 family transposase [Candidatus Delongbacteria bacterium]|nr:IS66 family transposase [Candidatus Delongbacteria bacterium]